MLRMALLFLILAIVAAVLGLGGIAATGGQLGGRGAVAPCCR